MTKRLDIMIAVALLMIAFATTANAGEFDWTFEQVEPADEAGWGVQIEMDTSGAPHGVYWSQGLGGYRYTARNDYS